MLLPFCDFVLALGFIVVSLFARDGALKVKGCCCPKSGVSIVGQLLRPMEGSAADS